jgi:hypothetical protein
MKHHFSAELQPIGIDEKNGIIRGAVACQAGLEAKGHSLKTDGVLLRQLLLSARAKGEKRRGRVHRHGTELPPGW